MGDYNGRIDQVVRAFQKYPAGDMNTRMTVRNALAAERNEGFDHGYREGTHDVYEAQRSEREGKSGSEDEPGWYEDWTEVRRDSDGNLILKHEPTGGLYRVLPVEEC